MKKPPHVIWTCPTSQAFYRSKGEIRCRPGSVIPKLVEHGIKINVLIPYDPALLPKTKLSSGRTVRHTVKLAQEYSIQIIKLTRGAISPGIYMFNASPHEPAISTALLSKAALALASQLKKPVDVFHLFGWESALLPLFLDMQKNGSRLFKNTHTFLTVSSLREQGNFPPDVLNDVGIPRKLFHPEGVEFFGKVSYLKAGLIFADAVGLVEGGMSLRNHVHRNGTGFEGVLEAQSFKLRRWASERSMRAHLDAYGELMAMPPRQSALSHVMGKLHSDEDQVRHFIESWGPPPPGQYNVNSISFLSQSPTKAYAFWEWTQFDYTDYGLLLEESNGSKKLLSRGLQALAEFWIEVIPDHEYVVELVGWNRAGEMQPLMRSRPLRIARNRPSANKEATFIDVKSRKRFLKSADGSLQGLLAPGGTSALEWSLVGDSSSLPTTSSHL